MLQNIGWIVTSVRIEGVFLPQNCTPLWFLTSLFVSQQVFYWLEKKSITIQCILSICFILVNILLNRFRFSILPWHLDVSLIGTIFMLIGFYMNKFSVVEKEVHKALILSAFILSTIIIFLNGRVEMYYRIYNNILLFFAGSVIMTYAFMWTCRRLNNPIFCNTISELGINAIIVMGLNYTINKYTRGAFEILNMLFHQDYTPGWILITLINILVCACCIFIFKRQCNKNKKYYILTGKIKLSEFIKL